MIRPPGACRTRQRRSRPAEREIARRCRVRRPNRTPVLLPRTPERNPSLNGGPTLGPSGPTSRHPDPHSLPAGAGAAAGLVPGSGCYACDHPASPCTHKRGVRTHSLPASAGTRSYPSPTRAPERGSTRSGNAGTVATAQGRHGHQQHRPNQRHGRGKPPEARPTGLITCTGAPEGKAEARRWLRTSTAPALTRWE